MALPDLTVQLTARTDGFETSLQRAAKATEQTAAQVEASTNRIGNAFELLKGVAAGALGALSIQAFTRFVQGAIDSADHLNDLSKKTGIAVETLGGFGFAAEQAGGNLDSISTGLSKLNLSLAQAAAGNVKAAEPFKLLGIAVKDAAGNTRAADAVFKDVADKFASYNDGPEKAALAVRIFGKAGADLIPVLDEGGQKLQENAEYFKRYSGVTQDLAEKSDQFNDTLTKLQLLQGAFGKQLAAELLPTLQVLADRFLEAKENGTLLTTVASGIGQVFDKLVIAAAEVATGVFEAGRELGGFAAKVDALAHLDIAGFKAISNAMKEDTKLAQKELDDFRKKIEDSRDPSALARRQLLDRPIDFGTQEKKNAPGLAPTGRGGARVDDTNKKLLDQELKELDLFVAREKELLSQRNEQLQLFYGDDQVSIAKYFAARKAYRDEELASIQASYAKEIAAVEAYIAKVQASRDPKGEGKVIEAQTKLIDIRGKLAKVEGDASAANLKDFFAQAKAVEQYGDQLRGLQAQVEALRGDSAKAFTINFDIQNRSLGKKIDNNLQSEDPATRAAAEAAKQNLASIRQQGVVSAALNDIEKQRAIILGDLQNAQERVNTAVAAGTKTDLEGLALQSEANRARVASLAQVVAAYERIAATSGDAFDRVKADGLRVELEKLASQTDLVADKFRSIGETATESFVEKITSGTATVKDAFKALVSDINKELLRIGSREISQQIFKKDGGLGGLLGQLTGGGDKSGAAAASTAATAAGTAGAAATGAVDATAFSAAVDAAGVAFSTSTDAAGIGFGTSTDAAGLAFGAAVDGVAASYAALVETSGASFAAAVSAAGTAFATAVGAAGAGSSAAGGLAALASANGNVFAGGNVIPFARGGVVNQATIMPMALMGESGPEAIVPLKRGRDGKLGIVADVSGGGSTTNNYINVPAPQTRDLRSASQQGRAIARQLR